MTDIGGNDFCNNGIGCGTIYKLTTAGVISTIYTFCPQGSCAAGGLPIGALVLATDGNFYGTATFGGAHNLGVIFKLTASGQYSVVHSFAGSDGSYPATTLVQVNGGALYGAAYGGANGVGAMFKVTLQGQFSTIYNFCAQQGCPDGSVPKSLTAGNDGNLYGVTGLGGALGNGTAFKLSPTGKLTTLHNFNGTSDGSEPNGPLVLASDGNFYGTALYGGSFSCGNGCGTTFRVTPKGEFSSHEFQPLTGELAYAPLIQATDGNFYGTSTMVHFGGNVFELSKENVITSLFDNGCDPFAGLFQATDGKLYGTTTLGGNNNTGTVFSIDLGLAPFVTTLPTSRKVGTKIIILSTNLTGASSVTFNGTPASFQVVSATQITATVPAGATTGSVVVVTPSGTLTSNLPFRVM